jgi:hypothetical protein
MTKVTYMHGISAAQRVCLREYKSGQGGASTPLIPGLTTIEVANDR